MAKNVKGECRNTGRTHFKKGITPWNKGKAVVSYEAKNRISGFFQDYWKENDHPMKGKKHTLEAKEKISQSLKNRYKEVDKKEFYINKTQTLRNKVYERDNNQCQECGKVKTTPRGLHAHHIDFNVNNNKLSNLISLCPKCHGQKHTGIGKGLGSIKTLKMT